MLTELEKTCGKTGAGKAEQEKSAAGKPEPGGTGPEQRTERRGPGMMEQEKMKQDGMQRDGVKQGRMKLVIGHLYPDLLNLYGDRGNIQCFRKRLEWRGMEAEVVPFLSGDKIDFSKLDIVLLGGGSDREQELVCGFLKDIREDFQAYVEDGGVVLGSLRGISAPGEILQDGQKDHRRAGDPGYHDRVGAGATDPKYRAEQPAFRAAGGGIREPRRADLYRGSYSFWKGVLYGLGNTGKSGYEGVVYKNVIAHVPARTAPSEKPAGVRTISWSAR